MSYNILDKLSTSLVEGVELIQAKYPFYDRERLRDDWFNKSYSVQMIQDSLLYSEEMTDIWKMIIFDCLIGNSDRHHSNWGQLSTIGHENNYFIFHWFIAPLYDNGSSLCSYINEEDIPMILKDKMKFEALINTKSKSAIGWENERPIRHFELLKKIKDNEYDKTIQYIEKIRTNINKNSIDSILSEFDNTIISQDMKKLLKIYILERRKRMLEIYNLKDEV